MIKFKNLPWKKENVFLTSDLHLNHKNICKGSSSWEDKSSCRKFRTLEEMNQTIIDGINKYVKEDDLLFQLGDMLFGRDKDLRFWLDQINCKNIIGIRGNHPSGASLGAHPFMEYSDIGYYKIEDLSLFLCHYPTVSFHNMKRNTIHLHAHTHGSIEKSNHPAAEYLKSLKILDVGIDNAFHLFWEYRPFSLIEIEKMMEGRSSKSLIDYH